MFEKNPLTLALIVVIIILAFMLYCGTNQPSVSNFQGEPVNPASQVQVQQALPEPDTPPNAEEKYQNILLQSMVGGINSTGIVSSDNVNSGLELGDQDDPVDIQKYQMTYQDIVNNEIGQDNIASQNQYKKYVKNDSSMRYLDTDLSANYSNYYGLSLSRKAKANVIAATDSSQIQGIDATAYDSNQANLREFYTPPTISTAQTAASQFRNKYITKAM